MLLADKVSPRALIGYATGLGWKPVANGKRSDIAIYHRPDSRLHQIVIPIDESLKDFGEAVAEAVLKLAEHERRPPQEILDHLLLPPADLLQFREVSHDAESGQLPLEHAVRLINGTKKLLLSIAHSVLVPQPYHPRLSRSEAEAFVSRCRLGQTQRGSFVLNVACPLDLPTSLPGMQSQSFTRQVTELLMITLGTLNTASNSNVDAGILDTGRNPGISANFFESLLMLRPNGDRSSLTISTSWSRSMLPPDGKPIRSVQLHPEVFDLAESLAPSLRMAPLPRTARFVGFVDVLRGQPAINETRPSGEVSFTLFDDEQGEVQAIGVLNAEDYAIAGKAHLLSQHVSFKGVLKRLPRIGRVDSITDFAMIEFADSK